MKKIKSIILGIGILGIAWACQDMKRPPLGVYPKDTNPVGGPLKFYTAFEGTSVDSIMANFGNDTKTSYVTSGVNGKYYKPLGGSSYITYADANGLTKATSFSISYWIKATNPASKDFGAQFVFSLPQADHWSKASIFGELEDGNQSKGDSAAMKFMIQDNWYEFTGVNRIPKLLDNAWHHMVLVYDEKTSTMQLYVDGVASSRTQKTNLGALNLSTSQKFVIGGPGANGLGSTPDSWMFNWQGGIDQFRIYGTALTAAEVQGLYTGKK